MNNRKINLPEAVLEPKKVKNNMSKKELREYKKWYKETLSEAWVTYLSNNIEY